MFEKYPNSTIGTYSAVFAIIVQLKCLHFYYSNPTSKYAQTYYYTKCKIMFILKD